jgi:3-phosphoglycerate kinase
MNQFKILLKQIQSRLNCEGEFWNGSIDSLKVMIYRIQEDSAKSELLFKLHCLIHRSINKKAEDSLLIPYFKSKLETLAFEFNEICNSVREEFTLHPVYFDYLTRLCFLTEKEANLYKNELNKKKEEFYKKNKKKHMKPEEEEKEILECKAKILDTLKEKLLVRFEHLEQEKISYLIEEIVMNSSDFNDEYIDRISRVKSIKSIKNEGLENKIVIIRIDIQLYRHNYENILDDEGVLIETKLKDVEFPQIKEMLHSVSFFMNNQVKAVVLLVDYGPKLGYYTEEFSTKYVCDYINKNGIIEQKVNFINNRDLSDLQEKLNSEELRESELFILENLNFNPEECGYEIVNDKFLVKNIGSSENLKYFTKLKYVDLITMHGAHYPSSFLENQIFINDSINSILKKYPSVVDVPTNLRAIGLRIESPIQKITTFFQIDSPNFMLVIGDFDLEEKLSDEEIIFKKLLILNSIMLRFKVIFILGKLAIMLIHFLQKEFVIDPKYKINPLFYNLTKYIMVKAHFNNIEIVLPTDGKILKKSEYENYIPDTYLKGDVEINLNEPVASDENQRNAKNEIYNNNINSNNNLYYNNNINNNNNINGNLINNNDSILSRINAESNREKKLVFKSAEEYEKYIKTLFKKEKKLQEVYQLYNIDNKQNEGDDYYLDELNENEDYKENKLHEKELEILSFYKNNQINFKYNSSNLIKYFVEQQNINKPRKIFKNELEIRLFNEYIYKKPIIFKEASLNKTTVVENTKTLGKSNNSSENFNTIGYCTNSFSEDNRKYLYEYESYEFIDYGEKTYTKLVNYFNEMNCVMWLGKLSPSHIENFDDNYYKIVEFLHKRKAYLKQQFAYVSLDGEKKLHESELKAKKYLMNFFLKSKVSHNLIKRNLLMFLQPPVRIFKKINRLFH